ncbi:hypothetical protein Q7501_11545, partial [Glaesserella parasuis]|nr:hypothetical protein [Glaesserella parasuis]
IYPKECAMARNELSKNARAIADLIYRKSASRTHKDLARKIGVSESQFSRVFFAICGMVRGDL